MAEIAQIPNSETPEAAGAIPAPAPAAPPPANVSWAKKALTYGKKNWWLILLPLPVIVVVVAIKHRKK